MTEQSLEAAPEAEEASGFRLAVGEFDGPFDLLLSLIAKHEMDITEISLSVVTNEFIKYVKSLDPHEELEQATEFLVVAATLLDLKVAGRMLNEQHYGLGKVKDREAYEALDWLLGQDAFVPYNPRHLDWCMYLL